MTKMKTITRRLLEAAIAQLETISTADYPYAVNLVESATRNFGESELNDGVCIGVVYGGSQREQGTQTQQQNAITLTVEAHKMLVIDAQLEGLDLIGTLEKALLGDKSWAIKLCPIARHMTAESDDIRQSEDGQAVIATVDFNIPIIKHHNSIFS